MDLSSFRENWKKLREGKFKIEISAPFFPGGKLVIKGYPQEKADNEEITKLRAEGAIISSASASAFNTSTRTLDMMQFYKLFTRIDRIKETDDEEEKNNLKQKTESLVQRLALEEKFYLTKYAGDLKTNLTLHWNLQEKSDKTYMFKMFDSEEQARVEVTGDYKNRPFSVRLLKFVAEEYIYGPTLSEFFSYLNTIENQDSDFIKKFKQDYIYWHLENLSHFHNNLPEFSEESIVHPDYPKKLTEIIEKYKRVSSDSLEKIQNIGKLLNKENKTYLRDAGLWNVKIDYIRILKKLNEDGHYNELLEEYINNNIRDKEVFEQIMQISQSNNMDQEILKQTFIENSFELDWDKQNRKTFDSDDLIHTLFNKEVGYSQKSREEIRSWYKNISGLDSLCVSEDDSLENLKIMYRNLRHFWYFDKISNNSKYIPEKHHHLEKSVESVYKIAGEQKPNTEIYAIEDKIEVIYDKLDQKYESIINSCS